jgi:hypothetical protein
VREANLALVLGHIARGGPVTRADLATATGLTRATVSGLVDELMGGGLIAAVPAGSLRGPVRNALAAGPDGEPPVARSGAADPRPDWLSLRRGRPASAWRSMWTTSRPPSST